MNLHCQLYLGNCLEIMKELPDNSVDSIVTDPPYGLGFMNKSWDKNGIAFNSQVWSECLRVLKSGGHLLSFGGTRTYHRMACAVEDAGFGIRDCIFWVYGSGFPKSLNISKAIEKQKGIKPINKKPAYGAIASRELIEQRGWNNIINALEMPPTQTKEGKQWEGWGTALKPAVEPIVLARKPLSEKTVAKNVLKWGTGGINIDGCRVATTDNLSGGTYGGIFSGSRNADGSLCKAIGSGDKGRFPANLIHDGSEEVVEMFPDTKASKASQRGKVKIFDDKKKGYKGWEGESTIRGHNDNGGSASRFFYCAKASKAERNKGLEGFEARRSGSMMGNVDNGNFLTGSGNPRRGVNQNNHPTVKPVSLMRYLCRLVTPPNGIVLDPFMGSGTTGIACKLEGFGFVGIEIEENYYKIAEARIKAVKTGYHKR